MNIHFLAAVIKNRKRRQVTKHLSSCLLCRIIVLLVFLLLLVVINSVAMVFFEGMMFGDALWLSTTTITTVGYGDYSPHTFGGRVVTIVCLYAFGIAVLSQIIGEFIDWRQVKREKMKKGYWEWKGMKDHIVIINTPNRDTEKYLDRLISQIRATPSLADDHIKLVTQKFPEGLPQSLVNHGVVHLTGTAVEGDILHKINLTDAKCVIVLARDEADILSDSLTLDIVSRVSEICSDIFIIAECTSDSNRERLKRVGAKVVLRPVRAYPELLVRALSSPGSEIVLENLFSHKGDRLERFDVDFETESWSDLVCRLVQSGLGIPLGFISNGDVIVNPPIKSKCQGQSIISMVASEDTVLAADVKKALA